MACLLTYMIISKISVNRLKPLMGKCISDAQATFVKDRKPTDIIFIANETLHMMNQKHRNHKWCALKLDISKAYTKFSWDFI